MGLDSELHNVVEEAMFGALDSAEGIGIFLGLFVGFAYDLGIMLLLGISLVVSRAVILAMIPFILRHSVIFLDIINFLIYFFNFFVDACITIIDEIIFLIKIFGGLRGVNWIQWIEIETVSKNSFKRFLTSVSSSCGRYDDAGSILRFIFGETIGSSTCPAVRFLSPLPAIERAASGALSWTYCGTARPITDVSDENCSGCHASTGDYVCAGLGIGYIVLEILVPFFITAVFLFSMRTGLWHISRALFFSTYFIIEFFFESISVFNRFCRL